MKFKLSATVNSWKAPKSCTVKIMKGQFNSGGSFKYVLIVENYF